MRELGELREVMSFLGLIRQNVMHKDHKKVVGLEVAVLLGLKTKHRED